MSQAGAEGEAGRGARPAPGAEVIPQPIMPRPVCHSPLVVKLDCPPGADIAKRLQTRGFFVAEPIVIPNPDLGLEVDSGQPTVYETRTYFVAPEEPACSVDALQSAFEKAQGIYTPEPVATEEQGEDAPQEQLAGPAIWDTVKAVYTLDDGGASTGVLGANQLFSRVSINQPTHKDVMRGYDGISAEGLAKIGIVGLSRDSQDNTVTVYYHALGFALTPSKAVATRLRDYLLGKAEGTVKENHSLNAVLTTGFTQEQLELIENGSLPPEWEMAPTT